MRTSMLPRLLFVWMGLAACTGPALAVPPQAAAPAAQAETRTAPKLEVAQWCEIARVVDADTIHVMREGKLLKLRLLCVDTEERFHPGQTPMPGKPETVFGEESALWAEQFFAALGKDGAKPRIGLHFPGGKEEIDIYGRTLCHVILPDGSDYNLQLVREGKSPYFNKYGNSRSAHEAFVQAQKAAQAEKLGIWNPATNQPKDPAAPTVKRDYAALLPWWEARAQAIRNFEARLAEGGTRLADAAKADAIEALRKAGADQPLQIFGEIDKRFEEQNGDLTLLLRTSDKQRALRVVVPKALRGPQLEATLDALQKEGQQNFFYVSGLLTQGERGPVIVLASTDRLQVSSPSVAH